MENLQLQILTETRGAQPPMSGRAVVDLVEDGRFSVENIAAGRVLMVSSLTADSLMKMKIPYIPSLTPGEDRIIIDNPQLVPAVVVRQQFIKSDTKEGIPDMKLRVLWGSAINDGSWRQSKPTTTDKNGWWTAHVLPGPINIRVSSRPEGYAGTSWFDGRSGHLGIEAEVPVTDQLVTFLRFRRRVP
ncbi:MAG: hypothetical protein CMN21_16455 [Rubinisphaera sp.]|nr:hypothetical protein [Rubinisphaera sp.]